MAEINKTKGNYTAVSPFPIDTTTFADIQENISLVEKIAKIAGGNCVIDGFEADGDEGTAIIDGEVLHADAGTGTRLTVVDEQVNVSYNGGQTNNAYTRRRLAWTSTPPAGKASYALGDLERLHSLVELKNDVAKLSADLAAVQPEAVGTIKMWPSATIGPGGKRLSDADSKWKLCNGADIPTGEEYTTILDLVGNKLPDMRGRFVVGYHSDNVDYDTISKTGGVERVTLTAQQSGLRRHNHRVRCGWKTGSAASDPDGLWFSNMNQNTAYTPNPRYNDILGQDTEPIIEPSGDWDAEQPHENRPPYIVMAYIIKVKL